MGARAEGVLASAGRCSGVLQAGWPITTEMHVRLCQRRPEVCGRAVAAWASSEALGRVPSVSPSSGALGTPKLLVASLQSLPVSSRGFSVPASNLPSSPLTGTLVFGVRGQLLPR